MELSIVFMAKTWDVRDLIPRTFLWLWEAKDLGNENNETRCSKEFLREDPMKQGGLTHKKWIEMGFNERFNQDNNRNGGFNQRKNGI